MSKDYSVINKPDSKSDRYPLIYDQNEFKKEVAALHFSVFED